MFNTPIIDVAFGLVLVYLIYSLLATSIKEAIATLFGLRSRMLRKGISSMLTSSTDENRWRNFIKGVWSSLFEIIYIITGWRGIKEDSLSTRFYNHPLISSYGSSRMFPNPSYIPSGNFSQVLLDLLRKEFELKVQSIAQLQYVQNSSTSIKENYDALQKLGEPEKIKALLNYHKVYHEKNSSPHDEVIDPQTRQILESHLLVAGDQMDVFTKHLETWFDDTMNRVSGWYKRQVQFVLFTIGIVLAVVLNIDSIEMASKLSKNKDLRAQMVQLAIQAPEKFKNDSRLSSAAAKADTAKADSLLADFQKNVKDAKTILEQDSKDVSQLLALGWDGSNDKAFEKKIQEMKAPQYKWLRPIKSYIFEITHQKGGVKEAFKTHPKFMQVVYVWHSLSLTKLFGFLLTAFAISLGAPFWFDLLGKAVNLRGSGKQEQTTVKK